MSSIVIQLQGGLVQDVFRYGQGEIGGAIIVDHDTEGCSDDKGYTKAIDDQGTEMEAVIHGEKISKLPKGCDVERLLKAYFSKK